VYLRADGCWYVKYSDSGLPRMGPIAEIRPGSIQAPSQGSVGVFSVERCELWPLNSVAAAGYKPPLRIESIATDTNSLGSSCNVFLSVTLREYVLSHYRRLTSAAHRCRQDSLEARIKVAGSPCRYHPPGIRYHQLSTLSPYNTHINVRRDGHHIPRNRDRSGCGTYYPLRRREKGV